MIYSRPGLAVLAVLAGLAPSLARAQSTLEMQPSQPPICAATCLTDTIPEYTCSSTNETCICSNNALIKDVYSCVTHHCTAKQTFISLNIWSTSCHLPKRDRAASVTTTTIILGSFTIVFVVIRLAHRIFIARQQPFLDDWLVFLCLLMGVPSNAITINKLGPSGLGKDAWMLPFDLIEEFAYWFFVTEIIYFALLALMKLALLAFYLRIFAYRTIRIWLWLTVAFAIMFGVSFVLACIFQCKPVAFVYRHWDAVQTDACVDIDTLAWCNAGINIGLDVWMLAMPLSQLPGLNLPWKKKAGVGLMFSVGTFVTVMSILRLPSLATFNSSVNLTWDSRDVVLWSIIEVNVGIMCTCMPSLRLVLVWLFPALGDKESPRRTRTRSRRMRARARSDTGIRLWTAFSGGSKAVTTTSINGPPGDVEQGAGTPAGQREPGPETEGITLRHSFGVQYDGNGHDTDASTPADSRSAAVPENQDGLHTGNY